MVGRKKKSDSDLMVNFNIKVPPEFAAEVEALALHLDRRPSYLGRKFLARGLAAYRRDGLLDEPEEVPISQDAAVAELFAQLGRLPIVMAEDLTPADADARPVASANPKHG